MTRPLRDLPFTLTALRDAYTAGVTPAEVMVEVHARLADAQDPAIFIHLASPEELAAEAAALGSFDPARPLWGVPFAVKDNIDVAGMPTTAACPDYAYDAEIDAFVVARLRAAGAIPVGKTNLDQFATGLVGVRSPYGVPRNALDAAVVPGGSSSGSAVAVAHGIVPFALGTDTAGSGRVPAALNGIVGLKPSLGALSASGVVPACRTLDTISIFALTVADAHDVFRTAAAFDPADAYSRPLPAAAMPAPTPAPRITAPDAASLVFFDDEVQAADFEATLATLAAGGAIIDRVDFTPFYDVARMLYDGAWIAERYAAIEDMMRTRPDAVHPVTRAIIAKAEAQSAVDAFNGFYRLADLRRVCAPVLERADMLCVPTIPTFAMRAELDADPITPNANLGTYTNFVNLLDLCALAVPTGPRGDGRPGGVTLIAPAGQDRQFEIGDGIEEHARIGMLRRPEEALGLGNLHQPAEVEHADPVRHVPHHRQVVADEEVGQPELVLEVAHQVQDLGLHGNVERARRLVADDELRLRRQRARDGDALALAAGELVGEAPGVAGREADGVEKLADPVRDGGTFQKTEAVDRLGDDVAHVPARVEARERVLEDHLEAAAQGPHGGAGGARDFLAVEQDAPLRSAEKTDDHLRDGRLARAALAHQREGFASRDGEADVGDRGQELPVLALDHPVEPGLGDVEPPPEPLDLDEGVSHAPPPPQHRHRASRRPFGHRCGRSRRAVRPCSGP